MISKTWELSQRVGKALNITPRLDGFYPDFSADMNTAWVLIEAMFEKCFFVEVSNGFDVNSDGIVYDLTMCIIKKPYNNRYGGRVEEVKRWTDKHAPTAILKAAAKALGIEGG